MGKKSDLSPECQKFVRLHYLYIFYLCLQCMPTATRQTVIYFQITGVQFVLQHYLQSIYLTKPTVDAVFVYSSSFTVCVLITLYNVAFMKS